MSVRLTDDELFLAERVLVTKLANLWIKPSQYGLPMIISKYSLGDNESLAGRAYLTNCRIIFKPHRLSRLVGTCSLFLPNVVQIQRGWFGFTVESRVKGYKFNMWFNRGFVTEAEARRRGMGPEEIEGLRQQITEHPSRIGALHIRATAAAVMSSPDPGTTAELAALFADDAPHRSSLTQS